MCARMRIHSCYDFYLACQLSACNISCRVNGRCCLRIVAKNSTLIISHSDNTYRDVCRIGLELYRESKFVEIVHLTDQTNKEPPWARNASSQIIRAGGEQDSGDRESLPFG